MLIISNNPLTWDGYPDSVRIEGTPLVVMREVRNKVQRGMKLITHPLAGNIRLIGNPFRSVALDGLFSEISPEDLFFVEDACYRLEQVDWTTASESSLKDYQFVDFDLLIASFEASTV